MCWRVWEMFLGVEIMMMVLIELMLMLSLRFVE